MASLVRQGFSASPRAVVASGSSYADALAASALAGAYGCPVVLTEPHALSSQASSVLGSLGATSVTVVGGPAAVSDSVAGVLGAQRVGGADRYATAVETMRLVRSINASSDTVIVATGSSFADALSVSPYAWRSVSPILLTQRDGTLRRDAIDAIRGDVGIRRVVLVGGTNVVSDRVRDQLGGGYVYERLGGANRYETSSRVADWSAAHGLGWSSPVLATGRSYADALSAASVAGKMGSVLLLADGANDPTMALLRQNGPSVSRAYVAGGEAAVPAPLMDAMAAAIR